jgi:hypothetical protein
MSCRRSRWFLRAFVAALSLGMIAARASALSPRDELLRFVPEDVGFCLVVQDLRGHFAALQQSPFVQRFRQTPMGAALQSDPAFAKLGEVEKILQQTLGVDPTRLRDDLLGDAIVFAYRPGPAGKMNVEDQELVLVRARDAKLLVEVIEKINQAQKQAGELKNVQEREYAGVRYYQRVEAQKSTFYFVRGPVVAFSSQEAMLRQAIGLEQKSAPEEPPVARRLRQLGVERRLVSLWVNPRPFDGELERKVKAAGAGEAAVLGHMLTWWKALDGIALSLALERDGELSLAVRARTEQLPPAAQRFLAEAAMSSELWSRFPEDALVAGALRIDGAALVATVAEFLPPAARAAAQEALKRGLEAALSGKDFTRDLLPAFGPDIGFCVTAPKADEKAWMPRAVLAMRVQSDAEGHTVEPVLLSALNSLAFLAVVGYNHSHPDVLAFRSEMQGKIEVKYFANDKLFPVGVQPAFAAKEGYLLLASSPEVIRRFGTAASPTRAADGENPLLRVSANAWREFLKQRREPLIALTAERDGASKTEASSRLDRLFAALELIDRIDLVLRPSPGQVVITLRVQTVAPLR